MTPELEQWWNTPLEGDDAVDVRIISDWCQIGGLRKREGHGRIVECPVVMIRRSGHPTEAFRLLNSGMQINRVAYIPVKRHGQDAEALRVWATTSGPSVEPMTIIKPLYRQVRMLRGDEGISALEKLDDETHEGMVGAS